MGESHFVIENETLVSWNRESPPQYVAIIPKEVRIIGEGAFRGLDTVHEVVLQEGVREIREEAFRKCSVGEIDLPHSLTRIRSGAFQECWRLYTVRIPEGVKEIGENAFAHCRSLKTLELPDSLEVIRESAFCETRLSSIRIPPRVVEVPPYAFQGCWRLESVEFPPGLRAIREKAFHGCQNLTGLTLSSSALVSLADDAFLDCPKLSRLSILSCHPDLPLGFLKNLNLQVLQLPAVSILRVPPEWRRLALRGLADWEAAGNALPPDLEEDVLTFLAAEWPIFFRELPDNSPLLRFLLRRNLLGAPGVDRLLSLLSGPRHVEDLALLLEYRRHLPVPDPEEELREQMRELETGFLSPGAFDASWTARREEGGGLRIVEYHGAEEEHIVFPAGRGEEAVVALADRLFRRNSRLLSVEIPEGVRQIGEEIFSDCSQLRSASLPSTLREIPKNAFSGCTELAECQLPSTLTAIGAKAFSDCRNLAGIRIPEGVQTLGSEAFQGCWFLSEFSLPSSLKEISSYAFSKCGFLSSLRFSAGLESVGDSAFQECIYLREADLPPGLKTIGDRAFSQCSDLKRISLPASLESIGKRPFAFCHELHELYLPAALRFIGDNPFQYSGLKRVVIDPANRWYRMEGPYLLSADGTLLLGALPSLPDEAFIPDSVETIGSCAFRYVRVRSITVPATVRAIGWDAFYAAIQDLSFLGIPEEIDSMQFPSPYLDKPPRVHVQRAIPKGSFRAWLAGMAANGVTVLYDIDP